MDITVLKHENKLCGVYLDNGLLLDARPGIGEAIKEAGISPKTVLLTAMTGEAIAGLDELGTLPIGDMAHVADCTVEQFPVGAKGNRKYGYSIKTQDGRLVYAPEFDRIEKSRLLGADLAFLDPGDRSEVGELAGLSHKSFLARERMATNAAVVNTIWSDTPGIGIYTLKSSTTTNPEPVKTVVKSVDLQDVISDIHESFFGFDFGVPLDSDHIYVVATFDDYLVVCHSRYIGEVYSRKYYRVNYSKSGETYTFSKSAEWQEVEPQFTYTAAKSQLIIQKEQNGDRKWMSISSSDFRDSDNEKVSTQAMDFAIEVAKKRGSAGNLVWDHYDELPIGRCLKQTRVGRFLVEEGEFDNTAFAQKAADRLETSDPGKYRISIGFKYWEGTQSDDGTFYFIDIFHRATTTHPSNAATSVEVIKDMKTLTPEISKAIAADLGVTEAEMDELLTKVVKKEEVPAEQVKLKEAEVVVEKPAEPTDIEKALKRIDELETALKAKPDVTELIKTEMKSFFRDVASGSVTRPTQTGAEVTEAEKTKVAAEVKVVEKATTYDAFYQQFTSANLNK